MGMLQDFIYKIKLRYLKPAEYYKIAQPKDLIVLHFTAGYGAGEATGDWFDMQMEQSLLRYLLHLMELSFHCLTLVTGLGILGAQKQMKKDQSVTRYVQSGHSG